MTNFKRKLFLNLKNILGKKINRKIVVFSADDYGNIRMASRKAQANLKNAGLKIEGNRFDEYDALENREDLTQLFEVLSSVKDKHGRNAVFTAFALPANIDFEAVRESGYTEYHYELLPVTLNRLQGYEGTWKLWQEGIENKLLVPQFHGREHINLTYFNKLLQEKHPELITCINNDSFGGLTYSPFKHISYTGAFYFEEFQEIEQHRDTIRDGLAAFKKVFGQSATHFMAPGGFSHSSLEQILQEGGIKYIDINLIQNEHQGNGKYRKKLNYQGKSNHHGQTYIIRNSVFEPLLYKNEDVVAKCLTEIETAFTWNKPANISTHRVNFAGHIDPKVREYGLSELKRLLKAIIKRWPDVEFMAANEMAEIISSK